jgi:hypothetical protein
VEEAVEESSEPSSKASKTGPPNRRSI